MRSFAQTGDVLDLDPGTSVGLGVGHLFGASLFGVAALAAVAGTKSAFVVGGVVTIAKTSALAIAVGDALYWDATNKVVNKTSSGQQQVGVAIEAAANPSSTVAMLIRAIASDTGGGGGGGGGSGLNTYVTEVSTDTTLDATHYTVLVDATAGDVVVSLPSAASALSGGIGRPYNVKKVDASANTVTVDGDAAEVIDASAALVLTTQWQSVTVQSNGTSWNLL